MVHPMVDLAARLNLPYRPGDQDFFLIHSDASRALEFAEAGLTLPLDGWQLAEILGLALASYERFLFDNAPDSRIETAIVALANRADGGDTEELEYVLGEGWDESGPVGPLVQRVRQICLHKPLT